MIRARRVGRITSVLLFALGAIVVGTEVSPPAATGTADDVVRSKHAVGHELGAMPAESDSEARTRTVRHRPSPASGERPLGLPGPGTMLLAGVVLIGAAVCLRRHPAVAAWASGAIRDRAPPLLAST